MKKLMPVKQIVLMDIMVILLIKNVKPVLLCVKFANNNQNIAFLVNMDFISLIINALIIVQEVTIITN